MSLREEDTTKDVGIETYKDEIPNYLPLKLSLIGKSFAGKKTIAK